jgi:hypothetical protein
VAAACIRFIRRAFRCDCLSLDLARATSAHSSRRIAVDATPNRLPWPPVITGKLDTARLFNGITLHSTVETIPGADASTERATG